MILRLIFFLTLLLFAVFTNAKQHSATEFHNDSGGQFAHPTFDLNERLIEEIGFDGRTQRYAYSKNSHLVQSLDYRGMEFKKHGLDVHDTFPEVGEVFSDRGFMSTSTDKSAAFDGYFKGDVQVTAQSKSGVKVSDLSAIPSESEVLFKPSTKFEITKKEQAADGTWHIGMKEID